SCVRTIVCSALPASPLTVTCQLPATLTGGSAATATHANTTATKNAPKAFVRFFSFLTNPHMYGCRSCCELKRSGHRIARPVPLPGPSRPSEENSTISSQWAEVYVRHKWFTIDFFPRNLLRLT